MPRRRAGGGRGYRNENGCDSGGLVIPSALWNQRARPRQYRGHGYGFFERGGGRRASVSLQRRGRVHTKGHFGLHRHVLGSPRSDRKLYDQRRKAGVREVSADQHLAGSWANVARRSSVEGRVGSRGGSRFHQRGHGGNRNRRGISRR